MISSSEDTFKNLTIKTTRGHCLISPMKPKNEINKILEPRTIPKIGRITGLFSGFAALTKLMSDNGITLTMINDNPPT